MAIKISALDLDRVIQNALLYADEKAVRLNEVFFFFSEEGLEVLSCDDYIALIDSAQTKGGHWDYEFSLSISATESLGAWIKKDKKVVHKYDIILRKKMTGIIFECEETSDEDSSDNLFFPYLPVHESWSLVFQLLDVEKPREVTSGFSVRPERLAKLARVKADKEAPIALRFVDVNGTMIVQFKKGDTARGAIMPVKEEYVQEEFLW